MALDVQLIDTKEQLAAGADMPTPLCCATKNQTIILYARSRVVRQTRHTECDLQGRIPFVQAMYNRHQ